MTPPKRHQRKPRSEEPRVDQEVVVRRLAAAIGHGDQGAALARTLACEGVRTRADLKRPAILARLPRESQASVRFNPARATPLAAARAVAAEVARRLEFDFRPEGDARPSRYEVTPVGSVRRGRAARVKDLDFLVVAPDAAAARLPRILGAAALRPARPGDRAAIVDTYAAGERRRSLILRVAQPGGRPPRHYRADLFLATEAERAYALFHHTGSKAYNVRTRAFAKKKGWRLNQYGLFEGATERRVRGSAAIRTEQDLAWFLGVTYRPPAARER